jgi:hypothetical protein
MRVISYDGIQIDSYITPFNIVFYTEIPTLPTTQSTTDTRENGDMLTFLKIMDLVMVVIVFTSLIGVLVVLYRRLYKT